MQPGAARKKLKDVAIALAGGGDGKGASIDREAIGEMERFGLGPRTIAKFVGDEREREHIVEIEPENRDAVRLFFAMSTQWRQQQLTGASGKSTVNVLVRTGLDYGVAADVCMALCITFDEPVLAGLRIMEAETLRIDGERRAKLFNA